MTDKLPNKHDDIRINLKQKHEVNYWTHTLGVSEMKLIEAVKAAGPLVKDVREYVSKGRA
ncbi:MAG TPA: DUF3606 domain-containing protein [Flavisolibacter sp.]|nr:DUF3606 domain-containing protein [Flavisolibacter sp.]